MEKIRRYFYNNKNKIIKIVLIVGIVLIAIQILNRQAEKKLQEEDVEDDINYGYDVSVITSDKKEGIIYNEEKNIMQQFVDYCNEKEYEKAYELVSDLCKETLYPNIAVFKANYCDKYFNTKKTCAFQLWSDSIYMVEIRNDLMATGIYNENEYQQDYYTVVEDKINIGGYVGRLKIDSEITKYDITLHVDSVDFYTDYLNLNVEVFNMNNTTILLDNKEENNIILKSKTGTTQKLSISEIGIDDLKVGKRERKNVELKFYFSYRDNLELSELYINKILTNYEDYEKGNDAKYKSIKIGL